MNAERPGFLTESGPFVQMAQAAAAAFPCSPWPRTRPASQRARSRLCLAGLHRVAHDRGAGGEQAPGGSRLARSAVPSRPDFYQPWAGQAGRTSLAFNAVR